MTRLALNGVHLNVERTGNGPPLMLLHGFTGSTGTWTPFVELWGQRHELIAVDLLGHGLSDSPPDAARYRMERCIEDLLALVDRLDFPRIDLLGYSLGARVALHLAVAAPERIRSLVLESGSPGIEKPEDREQRVHDDEALANIIVREGLAAFVDYWERLPLFAGQATLEPDRREALRSQRLRNSAIGLANSLRGIGGGVPTPLFDRLCQVRAPTLLIAGSLDVKYRRLAEQMAARMPNASLTVTSGAGHAIHLERPEVFGELVQTFLAAASRREMGNYCSGAICPTSTAHGAGTAGRRDQLEAASGSEPTGYDYQAR